jgi:hypothetical protein
MTIRNSVLAVIAAAAPLAAQIGTSAFTGTVTDRSGAIVPAAHVEAVHIDTNFRTTALTNTDGIYRIQSLQPGPYRLQFSAPGFKTVVRGRVEVRTGETLAVNVQLDVASISEAVEVIDTPASPLETESSTMASVIRGEYLHDMPVFQRFTAYAMNFIPGMSSSGYTFAQSLAGFHLAGQRNSAIGYYEDGIVAQGADSGVLPIRSVQNGVAEVQVVSAVPKAEYGHAAGGLVDNFTYYDNNVSLKPDNSLRLDYQFTDKFKIFGSYTYNFNKTIPRTSIVRYEDVWKNSGGVQQQAYSLGSTWVASPSTINDTRIGFYRSKNEAAKPSYNQGYPGRLGIPGVPQDLFPAFNVYGLNVTGPNLTVLETITFATI